MVAMHSRCVECNEVIGTPLCSLCLADEARAVVGQHDSDLAKKILGFKMEGSVSCLSCGEKMGLCPRCFCRDVYLYLRDNNKPVAEEFLSRFDFNLRKEFVTLQR